jgi:KaiC/GvpD/RAD55 family RecA-like ATPase
MPAERRKEFKPRRNYCIMSEGARDAIPFLKKVSKDAGNVLLVTSAHPNKLKEDYGLEGVDIMWVTDEPSKEIKSVAPGRMKFEMSKDLLAFISSNDRGVIFLEGIEFLILINGFDEVLKFVKQILDKSSGKGITAMVSINPKSIAEAQFMMFRNRFDDSGWTNEFKLAGESDYDIPHLPNIPILQKAEPEKPPEAPEPEKKREPVEASEEEEEKKRPGSSKRAPTGVPGFDVLIEGGIPRGSAVLLQGPPGVERDSFWIQFIAEALRSGESAIVTVSSTSPDELRTKFRNFGIDLKKYEDERKIIIIDWYSYRNERILGIEERGVVYRCSKGLTNLEIAMTKAMRVSMVKGQRTCAVIDVLSSAITSLKFDPVYKFAQALRAKFRKYTVTAMFLLDRGTHEKEQVASLQQVFDGVIDIERERVGTKMERHVAVLAMEGTYFESEYFPIGLTKEKGIHVIGTEKMEASKEEVKPVAPPKAEKKEVPEEELKPNVAPKIERKEAPRERATPVIPLKI